MKKVGLFYGSSTGMTEDIAERIADALGIESSDVKNVSDLDKKDVTNYDILVLGSSTWGDGELQDDWYEGVQTLKRMDLSGKMIALFGLGDAESYPDSFCSVMGDLYDELKDTGATFIGSTSTEGYTYDDTKSLVDGKFIGLAIDEVNEPDKTDDRIAVWTKQIKQNFT